jgi:sugar O-acyltransferase (sialic acid O-acetyltransferase NeuD family)
MKRLIFIGSSGHARVAIDAAERMGCFEILGCIDDFRPVGESTLGYPVLGCEHDLDMLIARFNVRAYFVAIGDNAARAAVVERIRRSVPEFTLETLIHPAAVIARDVAIGKGSIVMAGTVINPCCIIGQGCIVNTGASLDHDCFLEDYVSVAPGVVVGGSCRIGSYSAVGIGAIVTHRRTIGRDTVIGAGATVLADIPTCCVAFGTPATPIRARIHGERYL